MRPVSAAGATDTGPDCSSLALSTVLHSHTYTVCVTVWWLKPFKSNDLLKIGGKVPSWMFVLALNAVKEPID